MDLFKNEEILFSGFNYQNTQMTPKMKLGDLNDTGNDPLVIVKPSPNANLSSDSMEH